jgi:hypothetical protein
LGLSFPKALLDSQEMLDCWTEVNKNIILYVLNFEKIFWHLLIKVSCSENDLLSFKKEVVSRSHGFTYAVLESTEQSSRLMEQQLP